MLTMLAMLIMALYIDNDFARYVCAIERHLGWSCEYPNGMNKTSLLHKTVKCVTLHVNKQLIKLHLTPMAFSAR